MKDHWKDSVLILSNLCSESSFVQKCNSHQAKEHIQGLMECINQLFKENRRVKHDLEEQTIKNCSLTHKYKALKEKVLTDLETAKRNAKAINQKRIRRLQIRNKDNQLQNMAVEQRKEILLEENRKFEENSCIIQDQKNEMISLVSSVIGQRTAAKIKLINTRNMIAQAHENAAKTFERIKREHKQHLEVMEECRKEVLELETEACHWNEKVKQQDKEVVEQKSSAETIDSNCRKSQARNKGVLRTLSEESRKVAIVEIKRERLSRKKSRNENFLNLEKETVQQHKTELVTKQNTYEEKFKVLKQQAEDAAAEACKVASESEQLHPERCALEEKRDKKRTQLHELRSELRSNKQIIQGANDQLNQVLDEIGTVRLYRMMQKEHLLEMVDSRQTMEQQYAKGYKVLKEEYLKERKATDAVREEIRNAQLILQQCFNDVLGHRQFTRSKELEAQQLWEALEAKEEKLFKALTNMKVTGKNCEEQAKKKKKALMTTKETLTNLTIRLTDSITTLQVSVAELQEQETTLQVNCAKLVNDCEQQERKNKRWKTKYGLLQEPYKTAKEDVVRARRRLKGVLKAGSGSATELDVERDDAIKLLQQHSQQAQEISFDISRLLELIGTLKRATGDVREKSFFVSREISDVRTKIRNTNNNLFQIQMFRSLLRSSWHKALSRVKETGKIGTEIVENDLNELHGLQRCFSERAALIESSRISLIDTIKCFCDVEALMLGKGVNNVNSCFLSTARKLRKKKESKIRRKSN